MPTLLFILAALLFSLTPALSPARPVAPAQGSANAAAQAAQPAQGSASAAVQSAAPAQEAASVDLLRLADVGDYTAWMKRYDWEDVRPFSDSTERFQLRGGTLRMESRDESFIIASDLSHHLSKSLAEYPFLRFVIKIGDVPRGAQLDGAEADDAAFRLYAVFNRDPWQALAYVWSWRLPVGSWSPRGRSLWGDFRGIRRKAFGQGEPLVEQWLTVEVNLRSDFKSQWPGQPLPVMRGVALKTDSNDVEGQRSLVWLRSASLHRSSLRAEGYDDWHAYQGTTIWFR